MSADLIARESVVVGPPRVLVALDKFKSTLTGPGAADAMTAGARDWAPGAKVRQVVVAVGGDGTVGAALAAGGSAVTTLVQGPLSEAVAAGWAVLGSMDIIELSAASGQQLLKPSDATSRQAHTSGTGQLIHAALDQGMTRIVIWVGGSASTDGGTGILRALGFRFLEVSGKMLELGGADLVRLAEVDLSRLDQRLRGVTLTVICDVTAPLLGPDGATGVLSTQNGAGPATQDVLERGLATLAPVIKGGAAGGTAGGLHGALGAEFVNGVDLIADLTGLAEHLEWADVVITGEGPFDRQSVQGKARHPSASLSVQLRPPFRLWWSQAESRWGASPCGSSELLHGHRRETLHHDRRMPLGRAPRTGSGRRPEAHWASSEQQRALGSATPRGDTQRQRHRCPMSVDAVEPSSHKE